MREKAIEEILDIIDTLNKDQISKLIAKVRFNGLNNLILPLL